MSIRKVTCLDGTSYHVGLLLPKNKLMNTEGTVKEIFLCTFDFNSLMCEVVVQGSNGTEIHIPYHAVLLYIEE